MLPERKKVQWCKWEEASQYLTNQCHCRNKSLSTLGKCIHALVASSLNEKVHVPFRDSVLTWCPQHSSWIWLTWLVTVGCSENRLQATHRLWWCSALSHSIFSCLFMMDRWLQSHHQVWATKKHSRHFNTQIKPSNSKRMLSGMQSQFHQLPRSENCRYYSGTGLLRCSWMDCVACRTRWSSWSLSCWLLKVSLLKPLQHKSRVVQLTQLKPISITKCKMSPHLPPLQLCKSCQTTNV